MNIKLLSQSNTLTNKTPLLLLFVFSLMSFFMGQQEVRAQVSSYQVEQLQISPAYVDLDVNTKEILSTPAVWDDGVVNTPIGFTFKFNGIDYTSINVSLDGFITFGATAPSATNTTPLSSPESYDGAVAGYAREWAVYSAVGTPQANSVSKFLDTSGGVGNYILKVEYRAVRISSATSGNISFQIWLHETTNVVEVRYGVQTSFFNVNVTGQMGLRGADATDFNNLGWGTTSTWPSTPLMTVNPTNGGTNTAATTVGIRSGAVRIVTAANRMFRWTPVTCFVPTSIAVANVSAAGATVTWTAPTPIPAGYQYEVRTSGAAGSGATGLVQSGTTATSPLNLSGLPAATTYYIYIRSDCGGSFSAWTAATSFTTLCASVGIPYYLYFDPGSESFTVPGLPICTSVQQMGTGNLWVTSNISDEGFGDFEGEYLAYNFNGANPANVWFYTRGVNLIAGNTYRLSYDYGGSTNFSFYTNQMEVAFGTSPEATSMTTQLVDHTNIKESPLQNVINFTAPSTGVFYVGFRAHSAANMGRLFLDNVQIVNSICLRPLAATITNVGYNAATASWTAPSPAPASGYAYYLSTSPTPPNTLTIPTGYTSAGTTLVNLTGLMGSTQYYFWVRGNCGSPDNSEWSPVVDFTTTSTPPYCIPSSTQNTTPINNVTTTNAVTNINNSSAWVAPGYSDYTSLMVTESQGGTLNFSIAFNASGGVGIAIYVDWNGDGVFAIGERMYNSAAYLGTSPVTGSFTVPLSATLGVTRMRVVADYWATNPAACTLGGSTTRGEVEDYSFKVVIPPPALTISSTSSTQCASTPSPVVTITSNVGDYDTYSWSPAAGVSGSVATGWTFTSGTSLTYTLTGTQTSGDLSVNTVQFAYNANPLPTPITLTTTPSATACQSGPAVAINATGGVVSGVPVYSENFNTGAAGWTETHGNAPNYANSVWTIRPDGFDPLGGSWGTTILHSNDNTSFFFSDADSQGPGNANDNILISPVFSLAGYTAASLSFWHFYRQWSSYVAKVEISTNGGTSWVAAPLATYSSTQGAPATWTQAIIDLNAYIGQSNLRIRFNYQAVWGWGWGIDNFVVSGSATSAITWAPAAGLYMDAAATVPYVSGTGTQTVYAMPSTTTTFTASASTPSPTVCTTTSSATITVTPIVAGSVSPPTQNACGAPTPLSLTGQSGTITGWEWSTSSTFATTNPIAGTAGATTLSAAQIGTFTGTRYFRAVVNNGSCNAYAYATSPNYASVTYDSVTWNGSGWSNGTGPNAGIAAVFAGNYTSSGNLDACSVVVSSGNVTFLGGHTLNVVNAVSVTGGSLTFNDDASLVQTNDAAVNSGFITYHRQTTPMRKYDYTYWSSPLHSQTLIGVSPLTDPTKYFQFDPNANTYVSVPGFTPMELGRGYIIRVPDSWSATVPAPFNAVLNGNNSATPSGTPNNGVINTTISGAFPAFKFNLLGNPYPSALDADLFYAANSSLIDGNFYFWTHNTPINPLQYNQNDYAVYNATGGTNGQDPTGPGDGSGNTSVPDGNIAAAQGFFVHGIANGSVTYNNSMRLAGSNGNFFRQSGELATPSALERHRIWLKATNAEGAYKQMLVGYVQGASNAKENRFDAEVAEAGNVVNLYSVVDEHKLVIQGRALPFVLNDEVPLGFKSTIGGNFQIALDNFDGLFLGQDIYVEDKLLNVIHDLKSGAYTFATEVGTFDDRFVLRFTTETALAVNDNVLNANSVVVYRNDAGINIGTSTFVMDSVKIFDIRGRLLMTKEGINSNETVISGLGAEEQVLFVQITTNEGKVVTKKIVY